MDFSCKLFEFDVEDLTRRCVGQRTSGPNTTECYGPEAECKVMFQIKINLLGLNFNQALKKTEHLLG